MTKQRHQVQNQQIHVQQHTHTHTQTDTCKHCTHNMNVCILRGAEPLTPKRIQKNESGHLINLNYSGFNGQQEHFMQRLLRPETCTAHTSGSRQCLRSGVSH